MNTHLGRLFLRHILRGVGRHPGLALLNVLSIGLGVAVVMAIQSANQSALASFEAGIDLVAGRAHLEVRAPDIGVSETLFPELRARPDLETVTPLVETVAVLPYFPGEFVRVIGIDLFSHEPFRAFSITDAEGGPPDFEKWLGPHRTLALSRALATRLDLEPGHALTLSSRGREQTFVLRYLIDTGRGSDSAELAVMDIGWLQEWLGMAGELTRLQIRVSDGLQASAIGESLERDLPPGLRVEPPAQRSSEVEKMLAGFRLNLTALSLVALMVGMFLVYNSVAASVVRRRREIGILRAMGAGKPTVMALFLGEALIYGAGGVLIGWVGGLWLAHDLLGAVTETISTLYIQIRIAEAGFPPWIFAASAAAGLGAALLAAWPAAAEAARTRPTEVLSGGSHGRETRFRIRSPLYLGILCLSLSFLASWAAISGAPAWLGFAAAFLLLAGAALAAPGVCWLTARTFGKFAHQTLSGSLATQNFARSVRRNAVTVAALMAALAMMTGIVVMVHSFRQSVELWIEGMVVADLFAAPTENEILGPSTFLPSEVKAFFDQQPEVEATGTYRQTRVVMDGTEVDMAAVRTQPRQIFEFRSGNPAALREQFNRGEVIWITESFARRHRLREDDTVQISTPLGPRDFLVGGVYYDYTSDRGLILMHGDLFAEIWNDDRFHSLAVFLHDGASTSDLQKRFRKSMITDIPVSVYSNRGLRKRIMEIFDQTFAVTWVLRSIAIVVALAGVCLGMGILVRERSSETALLRSLGAGRWQIVSFTLCEAIILGTAALVSGLAAGTGLAAILTWVINLAFFGWTIQWSTPWEVYWLTPLWLIPVVLLAALYPAWQAARTPLNEALRTE